MAQKSKHSKLFLIVLTCGPIFIPSATAQHRFAGHWKAWLRSKVHFAKISQYLDLFFLPQAAEKLNCCIFVHPWDMQIDGRMSKYWFPWLIGKCILSLLNLHLWIGLCPGDCCQVKYKYRENHIIFLSNFLFKNLVLWLSLLCKLISHLFLRLFSFSFKHLELKLFNNRLATQ